MYHIIHFSRGGFSAWHFGICAAWFGKSVWTTLPNESSVIGHRINNIHDTGTSCGCWWFVWSLWFLADFLSDSIWFWSPYWLSSLRKRSLKVTPSKEALPRPRGESRANRATYRHARAVGWSSCQFSSHKWDFTPCTSYRTCSNFRSAVSSVWWVEPTCSWVALIRFRLVVGK